MAYKTNQQKEAFWKGHLAEAKAFSGSITEYCRSHDLEINTFHYWRNKLEKPVPPKSAAKSFLPVKLEESTSPVVVPSGMPDPKWVAEIIFELHLRSLQ